MKVRTANFHEAGHRRPESPEYDCMIYRFPIYIPAIAVVVAVVAAAIGIFLLCKRRAGLALLGVFALFVSALAGGFFAPTFAMDRVVLDDEKLEQTTGFWWAPTIKGFHLAGVDSVTIRTATNYQDRQYELWVVKLKDGTTREIDPGDLWDRHAQDILERLKAKGIAVRR
jgi:hypothetical protein